MRGKKTLMGEIVDIVNDALPKTATKRTLFKGCVMIAVEAQRCEA